MSKLLARIGVLLVLAVVVGACGGNGDHYVVHAHLEATRLALRNGLQVILHPDPSFRHVAVNVRYNVGARHDPSGATGLAHLVEHLTFRSKPDGSLDAFSLLEQSGSASHNATTSEDATDYYETVGSSQLPLALFIEAARMARPLDSVDDAAFRVERDVVRNERRERIDDVPYGELESIARYLLFDAGPYGTPPAGFAQDLERLTFAQAKSFVGSYYRPNNATLVIAGGFDVAQARWLVHRLFDSIPGGPIPETPPLPEAKSSVSHQGLSRMLSGDIRRVVDVGVDAPAVLLAWRVPPAGRRGWHEMLITSELFGATKYKLGASIRRMVVEVDSGDAASVLFVRAELAPKVDPDDVVDEIDSELKSFLDSGLEIGLGRVKSRLIAEQTLALEALDDRARSIQLFFARDGDPDGIQAELHELSLVTHAHLAEAVDRYLVARRRVVLEARPKPGAPRGGAWPSRSTE